MKRLFILSLIVSCQGQIDKPLEGTEDTKEIISQAQLEAYCFYKLDDKYCEVTDPTVLLNWQEDKTAALSHHDIRGNLFEHKGGGPNGAEWNPSTDLFIVVNQYTANFVLLQNQLEYECMSELIGGYTWISLSQNEWVERLVDVTDEHWKDMFPNGPTSESDDFGLENAIQPPKTGQVLPLTFVMNEDSTTYYFYAAFGE